MKLRILEKVINDNFPECLRDVKACISVFAQLRIQDVSQPIGLVLVGAPASQKGTVLSMFKDVEKMLWVDDFTPRSFVSHYKTGKNQKLEDIDLLPKIKDKVMITPELAPLFNAHKDEMMKSLAIQTRVFDGQGYMSSSGIHGLRGYVGTYMFGFIGATVPLQPKTWRILGKLGSRWLFLNTEKARSPTKQILIDDYSLKLEECREVVTPFVNSLFKKGKIKWNKKKDNYLDEIMKLSDMSCKMRGDVSVWKDYWREQDFGGSYMESNMPIIEQPHRIATLMYNLARGHALIDGRKKINKIDMALLDNVFMSSMPEDRRRTMLIIKKHGEISAELIEKELRCSQATSYRIMETLRILGIGEEDIEKVGGAGRPKIKRIIDMGEMA